MMRYIEKTMLIARINQLIKQGRTGSAREFAQRIGVSKSTVYDILETMKMMGAEIEYCRNRRSYYYLNNKVLLIGFVNASRVKGGNKSRFKFECPEISDNYYITL